MNREILFRGKRIDNGKWVYGYYIKLKSCDETLHIIVDEHGEYHRIMPDILEQYIELTDKNGVKIFKGDILRDVDNNDLYIVECGHTAFGFDVRIIGEEDPYWTTFYDVGIDEDHNRVTGAVVIGNIHDNPELLGGITND